MSKTDALVVAPLSFGDVLLVDRSWLSTNSNFSARKSEYLSARRA